jgi:hypothetical protein
MTEESEVLAVKAGEGVGMAGTAVAGLRELLRFPIQDAEWRNKFLMGSGLVFLNFVIPLLPMLAVGGYCLKVMRQAVRGEEPVLPEWNDWGDLITEGLKGGALILAYLAPGYLVMFGGIILLMFGQLLIVPITSIAASSGDPEAIIGSLLATLGLTFGSIALQFLFIALAFIVLLLGVLPLPLALGHYLHEGELSAGFRLREVLGLLKANKGGYLAAWVIYFGLSYVLSLPALFAYFTLVLICLFPIILAPVAFYIYLIGAAAFGQHYRESRMMWEENISRQ